LDLRCGQTIQDILERINRTDDFNRVFIKGDIIRPSLNRELKDFILIDPFCRK